MLLQSCFLANSSYHTAFVPQRGAEMKIAVMTGLLAKRNMNINTGHC
jgi:hypothetical protein